MNKQELMRKMHEAGFNCKAIKYASQFDKGYNNGIAYAINLLDKLDEPEKPIVPQFVADWFEDREHNLELYVSNLCVNFQLHKEQLNDEFANWYSNFENEPIQTLVKMKLYGYEVEKEKLYTVELPNPYEYDNAHITLSKKSGDKVYIDYHFNDCWQTYEKSQLTEAEIKKDFDWAWQFAKEVEE